METNDWNALVDRFLADMKGRSFRDVQRSEGVSASTASRWQRLRDAGEDVPEPRGEIRRLLLERYGTHGRGAARIHVDGASDNLSARRDSEQHDGSSRLWAELERIRQEYTTLEARAWAEERLAALLRAEAAAEEARARTRAEEARAAAERAAAIRAEAAVEDARSRNAAERRAIIAEVQRTGVITPEALRELALGGPSPAPAPEPATG